MAHVREEVEDVVLVERERRFLRKWLLGFTAILVLGLLGWSAYKAYPKLQERRLSARAERFFQNGQYRDAFLTAQRVLQFNAGNADATRLIAKVLEKNGLYESFTWWKRLAALDTGNARDAISLAAAALQYKNPATADKALKSVSEPQRNTAAYHSMAAEVALALNHKEDAFAEYAEALKIAPDDEQLQLDLATAQLRFGAPATQAGARAEVKKLLASKAMHFPALRALVNDANQQRDDAASLALSKQLAADPAATFEDQILRLRTLQRTRSTEFPVFLATLQHRAVSNPEELFRLLTWMNENDQSLTAIDWFKTLPPEERTEPRIAATLAQAYAKVGDWRHLRALVADAKWENFEFLRLAYLARVLREEGDLLASKNEWNLAMRAAAQRDVSMMTIEKLVASWGWEEETEEALWASANGGLNPVAALELLAQKYQARGDTRNLLRVYQLWNEAEPARRDVKNNVALLSLLLRVNLIDAYVKSWQLYSENPRAPIFAATFAYSLHVQGLNKDALKVMASLGDEALHDPSIAAYCAILLVSNGALDQAKPFLDLARNAPLLPEEKALLLDARQKVEIHQSAKEHSF